jgi:hypothetical protein
MTNDRNDAGNRAFAGKNERYEKNFYVLGDGIGFCNAKPGTVTAGEFGVRTESVSGITNMCNHHYEPLFVCLELRESGCCGYGVW